ncbi:MAG: SEC-C domain-containing protein, partial [Halomonas sp.]|uniref:SEC-C domain-containing protein n=1 Tax=Halomonas sp. TaxID=1486246 RepID=UPI002870773C
MHHDDENAEIPPELASSIGRFLEDSVQHIVKYQDAERYFADLDDILKRSGVEAWFDPRFPFWAMGRSIWNAVPLPSRNFRCAPFPEPRRNDRCPCGSGKKYKRCCQPLQSEHTTHLADEMPVIHLAVSGFTLKQRQAAAKSAPAKVRLAVASQELEERHPGKARNLLLALLRKSSLEAELQAEAVRLLGHAYDELGHLAAGEKAMNELVPQLTPLAASVALNWLASRCLADARPADALAHVLYAESLDPDSLVNGILKTGCLRDLGADAEAQRTAQAWLPVARELGDQEAIALLEEQASMATPPPASDDGAGSLEADEEAEPPSDDLLSIFGAPDELLRPIAGLLKAACRHLPDVQSPRDSIQHIHPSIGYPNLPRILQVHLLRQRH